MKRKINLELFDQADAVNFYTIRFTDEEISETDKFFDNFNTEEYSEDLYIIEREISKIGENGALERYFRPEGGYHDGLSALPLIVRHGSLRLFCVRIHDGILILGNGYKKTNQPYNLIPEANKHADCLQKIEKILRARLKKGSTYEYNNLLYEKLNFEIDL
ncbi:MAG: hypothetical protein NTU44_15310 [Bacteroidetes bacterium]|nr:hypothetical protein [Bacteroidota bacterium]